MIEENAPGPQAPPSGPSAPSGHSGSSGSSSGPSGHSVGSSGHSGPGGSSGRFGGGSGGPGGPRPQGGRPGGPGGPAKRGKRSFIRKKKVCRFCVDKSDYIDYKKAEILAPFLQERGKILPRRMTGTCARHQRWLAVAIKRAQNIALLPFAAEL
jgi:small subunit ribosomal protein S18